MVESLETSPQKISQKIKKKIKKIDQKIIQIEIETPQIRKKN